MNSVGRNILIWMGLLFGVYALSVLLGTLITESSTVSVTDSVFIILFGGK